MPSQLATVSPRLNVGNVTRWMKANNIINRLPIDLKPSEIAELAKELNVDPRQVTLFVQTTSFDQAPKARAAERNQLNGELTDGAVAAQSPADDGLFMFGREKK
ncbi:MAG: hypothetical protein IPJ65_32460 [Archangiaceae bacterium]|nr:hypothetical protein [Archangiaceae bacterium]